MQFETAGMHPSEFARYRAHVPGAPVCALREGDEIDIGGRCFEIVLIPGHTPGSIALLDRENRLLIAGDSVSTAPIFIFGEGRDLTAYRDSVGKLLGMRDRFDTVYASHGEAKIDPSIIEKLKDAAAKLDNGELTAQAPPFELPAKMYLDGGVGFPR
jgi:glyoxylase-like metal-dependent hydrolase (beta-lactamase superfamily II)